MTNQNDELDLMRQQMHELKQVINEQNIINEQLLRQVMASKSAWIRRFSRLEIFFALPYIILAFLLLKYYVGISWLFYGATVVMVTISIGFDVYINRIDAGDYADMPLLDLMEALVRRRRHRRLQLLIGLPVAALWLIWCIYELSGSRIFEGAWVGCIIGGIIGGLIGIKITNRAQATDAEAIKDIRKIIDRQE